MKIPNLTSVSVLLPFSCQTHEQLKQHVRVTHAELLSSHFGYLSLLRSLHTWHDQQCINTAALCTDACQNTFKTYFTYKYICARSGETMHC